MQKSWIYALVVALVASNTCSVSSAEPEKKSKSYDEQKEVAQKPIDKKPTEKKPTVKPADPTVSEANLPPLAMSKGIFLGEHKSEQTIRTFFGPGTSSSPPPSGTAK